MKQFIYEPSIIVSCDERRQSFNLCLSWMKHTVIIYIVSIDSTCDMVLQNIGTDISRNEYAKIIFLGAVL